MAKVLMIVLRPLLKLAAMAGISLLTFACTPSDEALREEPLPAATWFDFILDGHSIHIQLAVTAGERQQGLMGRRALGADQGMLFVFSRPSRQGFWMMNTYIPLDIGYFTPDGVLSEIYPMYPHNRASVESRRDDIQFCLEMNQGWFREQGVRSGAVLNLRQLATALEKRGFEPSRYLPAHTAEP